MAESLPALAVVVKGEQVEMLLGRPADRYATLALNDVRMSPAVECYAQSLTQSLGLIIVSHYSARTYSSLCTD